LDDPVADPSDDPAEVPPDDLPLPAVDPSGDPVVVLPDDLPTAVRLPDVNHLPVVEPTTALRTTQKPIKP
jgi:hypothetical protein